MALNTMSATCYGNRRILAPLRFHRSSFCTPPSHQQSFPSCLSRRPAKRQYTPHSQPAVADALLPCREDELIRTWIESNGGYVHPNLYIVDPAPCGCRGVVALSPISKDVLSEQPLVLVPEQLYMTSIYAREVFNAIEGVYISDLDGAMQLAILLAHERGKGDNSFWAPYIQSLPPRPSCAWHMTSQELSAAVQELQPLLPGEDLAAAVGKVKKQIEFECEAVATAYGARLGFEAKDLFWAKGQVLSRCYGSGDDLGLPPYIDLVNHRDGAGRPDAVDVNDNVLVFLSSAQRGQGLPLDSGDELCIDYIHDCTPLAAFLSFGFIPASLLEGQQPDSTADGAGP